MDKEQLEERQQKIIHLIKEFCLNYLNNEYALISEKLVNKLGREQAHLFSTDDLNIWAATAIQVIGSINSLFEKSSEPYLSIDDLNDYFGTNKETTGGKSKLVCDLLKIGMLNKEFSIEEFIRRRSSLCIEILKSLAFNVTINYLTGEETGGAITIEKLMEELGEEW